MKVKQLQDEVAEFQRDIHCDGTRISSHDISSRVVARCPETGEDFEVVGLEMTQLLGCGCFDGIRIILKKED